MTKTTSHNRSVGARGEAIAAGYLEGLGYCVLDRNWYSRYGELDLIVAQGDSLVAVEVKTRTGLGYGHPLQAITAQKAARLRRLLLEWCRAHDPDAGWEARSRWKNLRVDAIGIVLRNGVSPNIDHLQGIS